MLQLRLKNAKARNNHDGMISDANSSQDHSLCNQFIQSKLKVEAEMPNSEEDNTHETCQNLSLTSGMSNNIEYMDEILQAVDNDSIEEKYHEDKDETFNPILPTKPLTTNSTVGQRNTSKWVSKVFQTKPNGELPHLFDSVEGGGGEESKLSLSSQLMERDDSWTSNGTPLEMSVECINSVDTYLNYNLHGVIADMDHDFDFSDVSELASGYSPFAIAEEIAEPVNSSMPKSFMEDEACDCNGWVQTLEEQNASMFREAIKRRMYERKISASLYAMNGISECFHYTSEFVESMNLAGTLEYPTVGQMYDTP